MLHGENKLLDQLTGMLADDGCAKNFVAAAFYKDPRKASVCPLYDGAIDRFHFLLDEFVVSPALLRLAFRQANRRDFRIEKGAPGHDGIVDFLTQETKRHERVPNGDPCMIIGDVRELQLSNDVADGVDARLRGLQVFVDGHTALVE